MLKDTARDGRGVILADLSGEDRKRTTERDLVERFARLRHTMEYTAQMSVRSEK